MTSQPTARGLLLCDYVLVEERTRKVSFIGAFDRLRASSYPALVQPFSVYAAMIGGQGSATLKLSVTRLDTDQEVYYREETITFPARLEVSRVHFRLTQFVFPAPGWYEFVLLVDRTWVAQFRVLLYRAEATNT
jgi:hypothetical protein